MLLARCLDRRDQGHEAFVEDYTQAFLNAEVRDGVQLNAQPPEELVRNFCWTDDVWFGKCATLCWVSESAFVKQIEGTWFQSR